jgi:superfamily II DNA or RNA helicase
VQKKFSQDQLLKGRIWYQRGFLGPAVFSGGMYQVHVRDGSENFWPFLQITDDGILKDHFCTCDQKEGDFCFHEAAAWIFVFKKFKTPLHARLQDSLWSALCRIAAYRHGCKEDVLQGSVKTGFTAVSITGKRLFFIKPLQPAGERALHAIILQKCQQIERGLLQWSNLFEAASPQLGSYEYSFWGAFALWWLELQEGGARYTIQYQYKAREGLPSGIKICFPDVEIEFFLAVANWPLIISCLMSVESSLKIFDFFPRAIKKITYSFEKKEFYIDKEEGASFLLPTAQVGGWDFFPTEGFCPSKINYFLRLEVVRLDQINDFLNHCCEVIQQYLEGVSICCIPLKVKYFLWFDEGRNLHIIAYLYERGDLQENGAFYCGGWAFLSCRGFFRLNGAEFLQIDTKIEKEDVSAFVTKNRDWFHGYQGFQTHSASIESELVYTLSSKELIFESTFVGSETEGYDFNEWVYFKGRGFYPKRVDSSKPLVFAGLKVPLSEISEFIRTHVDALENVSQFFSSRIPLEKRGLHIYLNDKKEIVIEPQCLYSSEYKDKKVGVWGSYTYVEGDGFCLIPLSLAIPHGYSTKVVIKEGEEDGFLLKELDNLRPFILTIDRCLQKPKKIWLKIQELKPFNGNGLVEAWLLRAEYQSDLGVVAPLEIWEGLHKGKKNLFSAAGLLFIKNPIYQWLRAFPKNRWLADGRSVILSVLEWIRLFVLEDIEISSEFEGNFLWKRFQELQIVDSINLEGFLSSLHNYQYNGLKWLWFLYCFRLGGLLCDEMGLGKTHQAMALIASAHNTTPLGKFLVVCPLSVIFHWEGLLKENLPSLRVCVYYGGGRSLEGFDQNYDLVLTSYGILRREWGSLSEKLFDVVIFDEIQIAKNSFSQINKALKKVKANVRIGLTGTPIENNLFELKALLDIVVPGYMPSDAFYREAFVRPVEKEGGAQKHLLSRVIKPFVLRRKKIEVLSELPAKIEEIAYTVFSKQQRILYKKVYEESRESIVHEIQGESKKGAFMHVFTLFSALRQICNHPALYCKDTKNYKKYRAGKWDLFVELLYEIRESGQKLVVFSQYLGMIDIIQRHCRENNIRFASIVGSTKNRKAEVEKFQNDSACEVFIGSLQAAGVGIDLTAASVVIHYDRSWNPAKENQATDRVHRIGQSRGVQVFKFVTRNSIEEHIHYILEKKASFIDAVVGFDDQNHEKIFSKDDIFELLRLIDTDVRNSSVEGKE